MKFQKVTVIICAVLVCIYVFVCAWLYVNQRQFIYLPTGESISVCAKSLGATAVEEHDMRGILFTGGGKFAVVYHGNGGSACNRSLYADILRSEGYTVLLVEYPGYGNYEIANRANILAEVEGVEHFIELRHPSRTVLIGESLGSGVAAYHTMKYPKDRLVLIAPYDTMTSVAQEQIKYFPAWLLLTEKYEEKTWAKDAASVRIIYAENDKFIPPHHAQTLFESIVTKDKTITGIPNSDHNSIYNSPLFPTTLKSSVE